MPVLEERRVIGVISICDVVDETITEQKFVIKQHTNYITGG